MNISAHNKRRVYSGATRPTDAPSTTRHSLYRDLHPEMYSKTKPAARPRTPTGQKVYDWLVANGPHTGRQIAEALGLYTETVHSTLSHNVTGVEHVDTIRDKDGRKIKVWGVKQQ